MSDPTQLALERELFLLQIFVRVGTTKLTIICPPELKLNDHPAVKKTKKSCKIVLPFFSANRVRGTQLATMRAAIQDNLMRFDGHHWWFSLADLSEIKSSIDDMVKKSHQMKDEVLTAYDTEKQQFQDVLKTTLSDTISSEQRYMLDGYLESLMLQVPCRERVASGLGVYIFGPLGLSSLTEEKVSTSVLRNEPPELQALQRLWLDDMWEQLRVGTLQAEEECSQLRNGIQSIEQLIPASGRASRNLRRSLAKQRRKLRTAEGFIFAGRTP